MNPKLPKQNLIDSQALNAKILVTGASGLVGTYVIRSLLYEPFEKYHSFGLKPPPDNKFVYGACHTNPVSFSHPDFKSVSFDLLNKQQVRETLDTIDPDIIIHLAYKKGLDNEQMANNLVDWINTRSNENKYLLFTSTDMVYDGKKIGKYEDKDIPAPILDYGKSKLATEQVILNLQRFCILRVALVYGFKPFDPWSKTILEAYKSARQVYCFTDEYRTPIYAQNLADIIILACRTAVQGTFLAGGQQVFSRYEYAHKLLKKHDYNSSCLQKGSLKEKSITDRPPNLALDNSKLNSFIEGNSLIPFNWYLL